MVANACVACDPGTSNAAGDPVPGADTECGVITCDASGAIENGEPGACGDALASNTSCDPRCDAGYELIGSRWCSLEGVLNDTATCRLRTCDATGAIENGADGECTIALGAGSTCDPSCDEGFKLTGTRSCSLEGALNDTTACGVIECDASGPIENGEPGACGDALAMDATCDPTCDEGFELTGARSCLSDGTLVDTAVCGLKSPSPPLPPPPPRPPVVLVSDDDSSADGRTSGVLAAVSVAVALVSHASLSRGT